MTGIEVSLSLALPGKNSSAKEKESISDTLIAAAAVANSLTLVTKNVRHFPMEELNIIEH